jgi:hypothetical protein
MSFGVDQRIFCIALLTVVSFWFRKKCSKWSDNEVEILQHTNPLTSKQICVALPRLTSLAASHSGSRVGTDFVYGVYGKAYHST